MLCPAQGAPQSAYCCSIMKKCAKIYVQIVGVMRERAGDPNMVELVRARGKTSPHAPHRAICT